MSPYKTLIESNNFIVLEHYDKIANDLSPGYQSESELELEFIKDLVEQGYERPVGLNTHQALLANIRTQLQNLNNVVFTDSEWNRYVEEYLDKPGDTLIEKTRK